MDLEAVEAELKCQRQDLAWQQATHPLGDDDDAHTGAPSGLCFTRAAYNMASVACGLEDIFDTSDSKTNERLNEVKRFLHVALEQHAESSASRRHAALSLPSQTTATTNWGALRCSHPVGYGEQRQHLW